MPKKQPMVHAYDKTTGKKLHHLVPTHFVEAGSPFPNLAEQPSHRDRAAGVPRTGTRADLEAYAVTVGITADDAAGYGTKADLVAAIDHALNPTEAPSDPTNTDNQSGSNAAGGKAGAPTTKEK